MKKILVISLAVFLVSSVFAFGEEVDMRGKKGVVDPQDLKKYDPQPKGLKITEPPSPKVEQQTVEPKQEQHHDSGPDRNKETVPVRKDPPPPIKVPNTSPIPVK